MSPDLRPPFLMLHGRDPKALFADMPTPAFVIDEESLIGNGEILAAVARDAGCKILLAQKAFSNFSFYPLLANYLAGTEASGLYEARLGREEMPQGEVHVFSAAYCEEEFEALLAYADHIVFNSPAQLKKFGKRAKSAGKEVGLRINPECSTQEGHAVYDPCAPLSRLGTTREVFDAEMTKGLIGLLDGLHFHTLCEQNVDALEITMSAVEDKFCDILPRMKWLNMGGGHHITREDYDRPRLVKIVRDTRAKYGLEVYLEPGEAVALNSGLMVCRVLDIVQNGRNFIAVLDASAACHMPDVIEMPYTPPLYGADGAGAYPYRLAGPSCLAGDVIGDYRFSEPLQEGDILVFGDMAIYTTCKTNTFNGMPLPDIWKRGIGGSLTRLTHFGYADFKSRLG